MSQRAELIAIGGNQFISGLAWHTFADKKDLAKNIAKLGVTDFAAKHAVRLVDGAYASAGYLDEDTVKELGGVKALRDTPSFAAVVVKVLAASDALVAVPADDGERYALVEIRTGVVEQGNELVGTESEVRGRFLERAASYSADNTYAPKEWGIATAQRTDKQFIDRLVNSPARKSCFVNPTKQQGPVVAIATLALLAVIGGVGFQVYSSAKEERLAAERKEAQERVAAKIAGEAKKQAESSKSAGPWSDVPLAMELLAVCGQYLSNSAYEAVPGWRVSEVSCDVANFKVQFARLNAGTNERVMAAFPAVAVALDGKTAVLSSAFNINLVTGMETAPPSSEVVRTFVSAWQRLGLALALTEVPPPPPPNPKQPPPPPPYKTYKWSVTSKVRPQQFAAAIAFPTARITKVTMRPTPAGPEYQLEGLVYGT